MQTILRGSRALQFHVERREALLRFLTNISPFCAALAMHIRKRVYSATAYQAIAFPTSFAPSDLARPHRQGLYRMVHQAACRRARRTNLAINCSIILGGTSGVGREVHKYMESQGAEATSLSRRTGYDFSKKEDAVAALKKARGSVAISVGAGRRQTSVQHELALYKNLCDALSMTSDIGLAVIVLRSRVLPDVHAMCLECVRIPWVLLRPGPLVEREEASNGASNSYRSVERLLVTPDIRCNGLVSRSGVGRVVGDLLLEKIPITLLQRKVLGVYDRDRMINLPPNIEVLGASIWL